ncbi:MAG TPA: molybdenum cofactor guanylyltransferase [Acidobacteriaceae bacterium]|nr:molybdenum cofactor guanylyltransferase [Acidobacteriaceae bacterium]
MNAFVLAGGRSVRMGYDKALLELNGRPLIQHVLDKLCALRFSPQIVGSRPDLASYAPVIHDNYPNNGPLGGIEAALAASNTHQNLFLPVDLPHLPIEVLRWLIERATTTEAMATVPRLQGRPQPLCAIYSRTLLPHARAALNEGNAKVTDAVERAETATGERIDAFEMETVAAAQSWDQPLPLHRWFRNVNTPADFEKAVLEQSACINGRISRKGVTRSRYT